MPVIDMKATGANIKAIADKRDMRAKDIQNIFGFGTPQTVFKWFRGVTMPSIDNIVVLASIFDVKVDDIIITM